MPPRMATREQKREALLARDTSLAGKDKGTAATHLEQMPAVDLGHVARIERSQLGTASQNTGSRRGKNHLYLGWRAVRATFRVAISNALGNFQNKIVRTQNDILLPC